MRCALVHDWLMGVGGGEKTLQLLHELYPAPIYTLFSDSKRAGALFSRETIHTSFLQRMPFVTRCYRSYLPFFPLAIEQFDLSSYDLILSTSHCVTKGVLTHAEQLHICYCFTPVRYAWDLYHHYLHESGLERGCKGAIARLCLHYIRLWDQQAAQRVDVYLAISRFVARRLQKTYGRTAEVIYSPVDTDFFQLAKEKEDFYVAASRMVPYKKLDLIVDAFAQMPHRQLIVIGDGPERKKIEAKAGPNVRCLGAVDDETLRSYLQRAKAFVFAAVEDFGVLPVEAMSCGTPVIAFGRGGVLETVKEGCSGCFFDEQTAASLVHAVEQFERIAERFVPEEVRQVALQFGLARFRREFSEAVEREYQKFRS